MKKDISAMDLYFLTQEFQVLEGGKVDKIFQKQDNKRDILFRFHVPSVGKKMLRILLPGKIFLTEYKEEYPEVPPGYCMFLRKYLGNARLRKIEQQGFERILKLTFERKKEEISELFVLVIELFSKGNIILCNEDMKIRSPLENQNWADRTIRGGIIYQYPPTQIDTPQLKENEFKETLQKSTKQSVVKSLAIDFGLGGEYAEETCALSGIEKEDKTKSADSAKIFKAVQNILAGKIQSVEAEGHILPFAFKSLPDEKKKFKTFSEAIDELFTDKTEQKTAKEVKPDKTSRMITAQEQKISGYEKAAEENQKKGEFIYEHYTEIKDIIDQLNKAREKYSWKDIKKKLKGHKLIKQIDEKEGKIVIDLK
ncbi:MAG: NFACT family protein [Nanoarchaeota archaeon]|nr:NFACT family protein [Nanoarchaeota archaeon]